MGRCQRRVIETGEDRDDRVAACADPAHDLGARQVALAELAVAIADVARPAQSRADQNRGRSSIPARRRLDSAGCGAARIAPATGIETGNPSHCESFASTASF
jgi:hypothetical protein